MNLIIAKNEFYPMHWSILDNSFPESKFSKSLMKNFKIWLLPLKETFADALNTSDIHSNNLNFVFQKGMVLPKKRRSFRLEITAEGGLWYGLIMYFKSSFVQKFVRNHQVGFLFLITVLNETSWIFPALKSTSHFLPQSTVSHRSDSSSTVVVATYHMPDHS